MTLVCPAAVPHLRLPVSPVCRRRGLRQRSALRLMAASTGAGAALRLRQLQVGARRTARTAGDECAAALTRP
jgi:hypothetical protein